MSFWRGFRQPARYAVLAAGAVPVLAFPAANAEFLAWFGLIPGLALMRSAPSRREGWIRGWWFGAGYLLTAMYWLAPNIGPALLLVAIVFGFLWSTVGLAVWSLLRAPVTLPRALAALVVVPSCWLVTEWIRSWRGIGGPWAVLGASQWQHPAVLGLAAVGGVWLITFALVAANTGLLVALTAKAAPVRLTGAAAALIAIAAGPVAFALTAPAPPARTQTVALVQPGLTSGPVARLRADEQLTTRSAGRADLYVWGESSVGFNLAVRSGYRDAIQQLTRRAGAEILINQDALNSTGASSKQATLIGAAGVQGRYVKTRLVPFGEYIPFRSVLGWLTRISRAAPTNIEPGTGAHVLTASLGRGRRLTFGVLICFESAFPDMSRADTGQGAQLIIYQTSDATFENSWAPAQHAALSAVRAAETGRPVVQAALTGDSAAFDARGRTLAWAGTGYRGTVLVRLALPAAAARTVYDQAGDYVPWTAVGIAVLAALASVWRGTSARRRGRAETADQPAELLTDSR